MLLPLAPVRGVVKLAGVIQREEEQESRDPAATRHELEELQEKRARGEISAEDEQQAQQEVLATKIAPKPAMPAAQQAPDEPPASGRDDAPRPAGRGNSRKTVRRREPGRSVAAGSV